MTNAPAGDLLGMVLSTAEAQIAQANEIAQKVKAATTDEGRQVQDIIEEKDTQDDTIRKFQEWLAKIDEKREQEYSKIREYVKNNRLNNGGEPVDVDALKKSYADLKAQVTTARGYLKMIGASEDQINSLPDLLTIRGTTASTGAAGDGPKRPRISHVRVNGDDIWGEKTDKDGTTRQIINFTILGAELSKRAKAKVDPADLRQTVYSLAGTDDLSDEKVKGQTYTFDHNVNDQTFTVEVTV